MKCKYEVCLKDEIEKKVQFFCHCLYSASILDQFCFESRIAYRIPPEYNWDSIHFTLILPCGIHPFLILCLFHVTLMWDTTAVIPAPIVHIDVGYNRPFSELFCINETPDNSRFNRVKCAKNPYQTIPRIQT